jgi:hypothetical protein
VYAVASHAERCQPSAAANALLPLRYYVKVLMNVFEAEYVGVNSRWHIVYRGSTAHVLYVRRDDDVLSVQVRAV